MWKSSHFRKYHKYRFLFCDHGSGFVVSTMPTARDHCGAPGCVRESRGLGASSPPSAPGSPDQAYTGPAGPAGGRNGVDASPPACCPPRRPSGLAGPGTMAKAGQTDGHHRPRPDKSEDRCRRPAARSHQQSYFGALGAGQPLPPQPAPPRQHRTVPDTQATAAESASNTALAAASATPKRPSACAEGTGRGALLGLGRQGSAARRSRPRTAAGEGDESACIPLRI